MHNDKKNITEQIDYFSSFVAPARFERMKAIATQRTRYITTVLEDIAHPSNASAVVRSAECFGIQDIYIIQNKHTFSLTTGVAKGAEKWLDIHYFKGKTQNNTQMCYETLRQQGYVIVATTPHPRGYTLENLSLDRKIALVFGTEKLGLSSQALEQADHYVSIPMHGFTESLNISASAAICMYALTERLRQSKSDWKLTESEQQELLLQMLKKDL